MTSWFVAVLEHCVSTMKNIPHMKIPECHKLLVGIALALVTAPASYLADSPPEDEKGEAVEGHGDTRDAAQLNSSDVIVDPASAWDEFIAKHSDGLGEINREQRELLHRISVARVEKEGIEAFRSISESLVDAKVRFWVLDNLFEETVRSQPQLAFDAAVELRRDAGRTFLRKVALDWSGSDPVTVLERTIDADWDELELKQLRKAVVREWAVREPASLLAVSDQLPNELQSYGQLEAIRNLAGQEPDSAALHLSKIQNRVNKRTAAKDIAQSWIQRDVSQAVEWVQSSPELEEFRREILIDVLNVLVVRDPSRAFEISLEQPVQEFGVGLEVSVIEKLVVNDLNLAFDLLSKVREGTSKFAAVSSVGTAFADSGNMNKALELANELPIASRGMYLSTAVAMWGIANPKSVFEDIDMLPSAELKSRAAMMALTGNSRKEVLSKEQVDVLKTYLSEGSPEVFQPLQHEVSPPQ